MPLLVSTKLYAGAVASPGSPGVPLSPLHPACTLRPAGASENTDVIRASSVRCSSFFISKQKNETLSLGPSHSGPCQPRLFHVTTLSPSLAHPPPLWPSVTSWTTPGALSLDSLPSSPQCSSVLSFPGMPCLPAARLRRVSPLARCPLDPSQLFHNHE